LSWNDQQLIYISVEGKKISGFAGENLLEVINREGFEVPYLCHHPGLPAYGACRLCTIQIQTNGKTSLVASCTYPLREEELEVFPHTEEVWELRQMIIKLLLAQSPKAEIIQNLARQYRVEMTAQPENESEFVAGTKTTEALQEHQEKCILCGRCVRACGKLLGNNAISFASRGINRHVTPPLAEPPEACTGCGACFHVCPTGAIKMQMENNSLKIEPWQAEVNLFTCPGCGKQHFPKKNIQEVHSRINIDYKPDHDFAEANSLAELCPACRRKHTLAQGLASKTITKGMENIL